MSILTQNFHVAYNKLEVAVIKIRVGKGDEGKLSDEEIRALITSPVKDMSQFLDTVESLMAKDGFAFGQRVTWADYYLYPLLADLEVTPEGDVISKRLKGWLAEMQKLPEVKSTFSGTLADGKRPPSE